jgi:hypothetical protein
VVIVAVLDAAVDVASDAATVEAFATVSCRTAKVRLLVRFLPPGSYTRFL